jgi:anaerobic carbon-monoxide dehydrogenase iron sulfur subunit
MVMDHVPDNQSAKKNEAEGWGQGKYPYPGGAAYIECDEMKCVGCGMCMMACSMKHFGVINKELSRIQVRKYLLPLPKAVPWSCVQCVVEAERECQKACPLKPPAIHFDENSLHMVVDTQRCTGQKCLRCMKACSAKAVRIYPSVSPKPFVCDLCDIHNTGDRKPECVNVCPYGALRFLSSLDFFYGVSVPDIFKIPPDQKAEFIARRLHPLTRQNMGNPGWRDNT